VDDSVLTGTLLVRGEDVVVQTFEGEVRFPRAELLTIIPGRPRERDYWSGALTLGFTFDYGNTDQFKLTTKYRIRRQTAKTRLTIDGNGSFSIISDVQSENNQNVTATYNVYLTQRFYVTPGTFNFYRDPFTNISYRLTPGAGIGYELIDKKRYEWDASTGLQYQYTRYTSVSEGEAPFLSTGAIYGHTSFEGELTDRIDLGYSYRIDTVIRDIANYTHNMQCSFSYEITDVFIFDVTFYWDRVNRPAADDQGNVPVKNDFSIVFSTGVEF
jgi:putative salt-induced outer membrane protein YdiY